MCAPRDEVDGGRLCIVSKHFVALVIVAARNNTPHGSLLRGRRRGKRSPSYHNGGVFIELNDPSAGSPTETLLRLLLPLGERVQRTSRTLTIASRVQSELFTSTPNRKERRAVCTKGRDVINAS